MTRSAEFPLATVEIDEGETLEFWSKGEIAPREPVFFVGQAKSGSTLLHMIVEDLCMETDRRLINISDVCFHAGIRERQIPEAVLPGLPDSVPAFYYGFRLIGHLKKSRSFRRGTKIVLIRDPRDAITSLYFSMKKSHSLPKRGKSAETISLQRKIASEVDIDEFVLGGHANFIIDALVEVAENAWLPNFHLYRYEDVIFNKRAWIEQFSEIVGIPLDDRTLEELVARHDIVPSKENANEHIRQVAPGNFRKHLGKRALDYIDARGQQVLQTFGYT